MGEEGSMNVRRYCWSPERPFATNQNVPNGLLAILTRAGTCQVAYQTVAHLASGGQSWQPFAKYPEREEQPTGWQATCQAASHFRGRWTSNSTDAAPAELNHLQS